MACAEEWGEYRAGQSVFNVLRTVQLQLGGWEGVSQPRCKHSGQPLITRVARGSTYNSLLTVDHAGSEGVWCLVEVPKRQIVLRRRAAK